MGKREKIKRNSNKEGEEKRPENFLRTHGTEGDISQTSGSSGIGLRSGFLDAISLSPYRVFSTPFFLLAFFFRQLFKA